MIVQHPEDDIDGRRCNMLRSPCQCKDQPMRYNQPRLLIEEEDVWKQQETKEKLIMGRPGSGA